MLLNVKRSEENWIKWQNLEDYGINETHSYISTASEANHYSNKNESRFL